MLLLSIAATVFLGFVVLLGLICLPQMETKSQVRMLFGLVLIQALAIVTIWVLYGLI